MQWQLPATVKYSRKQSNPAQMIVVRTDDISEKQLAQIALAVQNRWEVPAFVKMHEIVIMDEDGDLPRGLSPEEVQKGLTTIFETLQIDRAFRLEKTGRSKFSIVRVPGSTLPDWMSEIEAEQPTPEGVFACPHCGAWFGTEIEMSLHTKLHYII